MPRKKAKAIDDNFIMSPKYDFVFKYIFGNDKHKDLLIALLSDILALPEEEFGGIEIINSELIKAFKEDRKGILDVRVRTKLGKQIDVEIPKLFDEDIERDENDPIVQWMEFLDAESKGAA